MKEIFMNHLYEITARYFCFASLVAELRRVKFS